MKKVMTTGFILEDGKILLGMKKRGFGEGRWNGFGGKVKPEESIDDCATREMLEESGINALKNEKMGVIDFEFLNGDILEVHFYRVLEYDGEPTETEEMKPAWFKISEIPYEKMWPDDKYWMPIFLQGKKFEGRIYFQDQNTILKSDIHEVDSV